MDISKEYIDMCAKARSIQLLWDPIDGDYIFDGKNVVCISYRTMMCDMNKSAYYVAMAEDLFLNVRRRGGSFVREINIGRAEYYVKKYVDPVWIPKVDQLVRFIMSSIAINPVAQICEEFHHYCNLPIRNTIFNNYMNGFSLEQLWICFVMKKAYNKEWINKQWVERKESK